MNRLKTVFFLTLLVMILAAACNGQSGAPAGQTLENDEWILQSMQGESPIEGSTITLKFEGENVSGSAGCNSYGGSYQINNGSLTMSNVFQTEMACMEPAGVMEQESAYLSLLSSATAFQISEDTLELKNVAGETILTFSTN